jgi:hypothetical protein
MKKINFFKKLYASGSDMYFITNRYEHLTLLDKNAHRVGANIMFFERLGQFSSKYSTNVHILERKMSYMGIANHTDFKTFYDSNDKVFFMLNNELRDKMYLKELSDSGAFCISVANGDSLYINRAFHGVFGNYKSFKSMNFLFSLLARCSGRYSHYQSLSKKSHHHVRVMLKEKHSPKLFSASLQRSLSARLLPNIRARRTDRAAVRAMGEDFYAVRYDSVREEFAMIRTFKYLNLYRAPLAKAKFRAELANRKWVVGKSSNAYDASTRKAVRSLMRFTNTRMVRKANKYAGEHAMDCLNNSASFFQRARAPKKLITIRSGRKKSF